jgi:hypothetical protein
MMLTPRRLASNVDGLGAAMAVLDGLIADNEAYLAAR